ncbi:MAG: multi-sensor signal transduction histidine kinase [Myxococcales bacterium]|nr:multi-sensor signal transduction histidine kinase [Myxococcales bacterium]
MTGSALRAELETAAEGRVSPGDSLVSAPAQPASDVRRRVSRLLLLRTLIVSVVLGLSLWLLMGSDAPVREAVWLQSAIIGATYASSIVFGVLLRRGFSPKRVARPMLANDLVLTSLLVYSTGGAQSPYSFLYALSIVAAGALSYRKGAVIVTIASLGSMVAVSLLAWKQIIHLPISSEARAWEQSRLELARTLGINVAALIGVGALAFIFADQLERGAETLATTRRAAAELLTLHQDIVRSLSSGLITVSSNGTVLTANQAASDILRRSGDEITGRPIDHTMPGLTSAISDAHGELRRADLKLLTEGHDLTVGVTVSPLRDAHDQVIGRVVNFQDLTELKRLEQHMRRGERLATVGQLAAGVAHEIRNPLASISGSIELLRQSPQASEDDRTLMTIVHREIQRLNVLIGDLLDYANPRPNQPVDFDLATLVEEMLQVARADQAFADVELEQDIEQQLPIHADPAKLRQVLWNLVRNAADAASGGGKHVRVEARRGNGELTISVADDGPGISKELVTRIFDPFFTTKQKGTGLGLATSHAVVAEHGGVIDVETELGKGTKMVVRLPRPG